MEENPRKANPEKVRNRLEKALLIIIADISGSMEGEPIDQVNKGISVMRNFILKDPTLATQFELAIITFHDHAEVSREFDLVMPEHEFERFTAGGRTNTMAAMNKAVDMARARKDKLKSEGIRYYRPIIALLTDGQSTNSDQEIDVLDKKIQEEADNKGIYLLPFAIGDNANLEELAKIAHVDKGADPVVYKMDDMTKFGDLFVFLSASAGAAVAGGGQAAVPLDPTIAKPIVINLDLST